MIEIDICLGSSCHLKGAYDVLKEFRNMAAEMSLDGEVEMRGRFCMQKCQQGVSVSLGDEYYSVSPATAREFFREAAARGNA